MKKERKKKGEGQICGFPMAVAWWHRVDTKNICHVSKRRNILFFPSRNKRSDIRAPISDHCLSLLSSPLRRMMMMMSVQGSHSFLANSNQYILWFPPSSPTNQKPFSTSPPVSKRHRNRLTKAAAAATETQEIRVCTNRTCRKQGSFQTLDIVTDLAPPDITVKSCGCLGRCGSGPNVAVLPQGIIVNHCGTAARAAQFMATAANVSDGDISKSLEALALRKRAQAEIDLANFSKAEELLSQAIDFKPFGGIHIMYKYRSGARLAMGNYSGALEDAREAIRLAPRYSKGYICKGDAFMAMEEYDAAEESYSMCLQIDPSIRRSKSFKTRVEKLNEKLTAANTPFNQHE